MRKRTRQLVILGVVVLVCLGTAGAVALSSRMPPAPPEPTDTGHMATGESSEEAAAEPAPVRVGFARVQASPSLDAAEAAGVRPMDWAWFQDDVPTPPDAIAGARALRSAVDIEALSGLKLLAAEEFVSPSDELSGRVFQHVMLKDPSGGVLKIYAQPLATSDDTARQGGDYEYRALADGGEAELASGDNDSYVLLVQEDHMVVLWSIASAPDEKPYFTAEELLDLAVAIQRNLGG